MNTVRTFLVNGMTDMTETIKEKIKRLHAEAAAKSEPWQNRAETYFDRMARVVGGYETLSKITGVNSKTILRWRRGAKPKFDKIIDFEIAFNDHLDYCEELEEEGVHWNYKFTIVRKTNFRACRWKMAPYVFENPKNEVKSGLRPSRPEFVRIK